jgi:hypothetical protein
VPYVTIFSGLLLFCWSNPEKLATRGTQDEDKQNKNNPEKLVTWGTQYEEKQGKNNAGKLVR